MKLPHTGDNSAKTIGYALPRQTIEQRLGIEGIQLAGSSFHEEEDNTLGFRLEMSNFGRERGSRVGRVGLKVALLQKVFEGQGAEAGAGIAEEVASGGHDSFSNPGSPKITGVDFKISR